ncbi:hypothetical protein [Marinobacter shengliensis]|uniref:hypothetical protein n=1 Tax=Marinobacter shengliensis TaxID=1389223 RepID=UPI0035B7EF9D
MNFDDVIESVRKPFASATSLSPEVFTSPKWFDFEKEHILYKHWNFVGLQQNVPGIGDYFVTELYGESIIIISRPCKTPFSDHQQFTGLR